MAHAMAVVRFVCETLCRFCRCRQCTFLRLDSIYILRSVAFGKRHFSRRLERKVCAVCVCMYVCNEVAIISLLNLFESLIDSHWRDASSGVFK
jgi:hypothetical protein